MADVPHIVFAARDNGVDARKIAQVPYVKRHLRTFLGGVLESESRAVIKRHNPEMLNYISKINPA